MDAISARQQWLGVLARAPRADLESAWQNLDQRPDYQLVRPAEAGLVMARGRAGGSGQRFNFGEVSVVRCAVQISGGALGYGYAIGRDCRRAELVAVFDGLLQDEQLQAELLLDVIAPLAEAQAAHKRALRERAEQTRVNFLTMLRGDAK